MSNNPVHKHYAEKLAMPMFALSLLFLVLVAILIVNSLTLDEHSAAPSGIGFWTGGLLLSIWPLFLLEYLLMMWLQAEKPGLLQRIRRALVCVIPPLRLAAPSAAMDNRIWLPRLSWRYPGRQLSQQLERLFGKPMLIIALLILPILLLEYGFGQVVDDQPWLKRLLHICTGFIWCAFAFEFIIMVSATDKKLAYVKKNWIDLAIILLPLISFLRSIRVLRLAQLTRVQNLAKLGRVYRMRGLGMKAFRALLLLQFVNKVLRVTPEKKLSKLREQKEEKLQELAELEEEILELEQSIRASE